MKLLSSCFLPASSSATFRPASDSRLAAQPPDAPEPTTMTSNVVGRAAAPRAVLVCFCCAKTHLRTIGGIQKVECTTGDGGRSISSARRAGVKAARRAISRRSTTLKAAASRFLLCALRDGDAQHVVAGREAREGQLPRVRDASVRVPSLVVNDDVHEHGRRFEALGLGRWLLGMG